MKYTLIMNGEEERKEHEFEKFNDKDAIAHGLHQIAIAKAHGHTLKSWAIKKEDGTVISYYQ